MSSQSLRKKRHIILHDVQIPDRKLRPLKWLFALSLMLFITQLTIELLVLTE